MKVRRRGRTETQEMSVEQLRALGPLLSEYQVELLATWEKPPVLYWSPATRFSAQSVEIDETTGAPVIRDT